MPKKEIPVTPAIRQLRDINISFETLQYEYNEKGGTRQTSEELNVDEHSIIKTLIFETSNKDVLVALMHGDMEVSTKELARVLNVKSVAPCIADKAIKYTGYQFGGTSPFGTKRKMDVYAESSIFDLDYIYINGGKQGFIIKIKPGVLDSVLNSIHINVGIKK